MPTLPRYESKESLTTQQPSPLAPDLSSEIHRSNETVTENVEKVGDSITKWNKSVNQMRLNQADYNLKLKLMDIHSRAEVDQDPNAAEKYKKEVDDAYKENNKGYTDLDVRAEASMKLGYQAKAAQILIDNTFNKKMIMQNRATTNEKALMIVNNPASTEDDIDALYDSPLSKKLFNPEEIQKNKIELKQDLRMNQFTHDFRMDPKETEKKFGVNGEGYGFTTQEAEKARSKMKEITRMNREAEGEIYADAALRVITGDINDREIDSLIEINKQDPSMGVTEKHGKQLKSALYKDISNRIKVAEYAKQKKAIDFIFSESTEDKITMYEAVLNAYKDGLTPEETGFLKKISEMKQDVIFAKKAAAGQKMLEQMFGARAKDIKEETKTMLQYAQRISTGSSPEEAARQTALDVIQKDHPAVVGDPDLAGTFSPTKGFRPVPKVKRDESSAGKGR